MLRDINLALFLPELFPDVGRVHLVRLLDVRAQVGAAHVGRVAHGEGADVWPLASVRPHMADEAVLDLEASAAGGALVLLVVATAPLLAVLPALRALERLATVRTENEFNLTNRPVARR